MITYFDASSLVKCFIEEDGSPIVRSQLAATLPTTSRLSAVEIASAICRRCREGEISNEERTQALKRLRELFSELYVVELTPEVAEGAEELLQRFALRAGDAIQLASYLAIQAKTGKEVLFSGFDQRLLEVAQSAGATLAKP